MHRQILIFTVVSACAVAAAACTTTSPPRHDTTAMTCIKDTGSRLPTQPGQCSNEPGRAYSQEDLQRTGQIEVGDALRMLDPSVTEHH